MINNNNQKLLRIKKEEQKMDKKISKEANILYVDDNPLNLKSFEIELKKFYNIFLAESATEGFDILKNNKIHVLVTDQRMPEMTGIELLEKLSEKYPETMRIILTAYDDSEAVIDAINKGRVHSYLLKSVDMAEVKIAIKNALDTYFLREENKKLMTELTRKNKALRNRTSGLEKEISKRRRVEEAMRKHHEQLEDLVKERTKELESKNEQLTREIAEHRQTEKELQQSEERYSLAERASGIGSWDRNIKTGDLQWSDTIEPLFGFKKGRFGKTYEAFLKAVHPGDRQFVIDSVNACIGEGKKYKIEHRIVCADGSVKWVLETGDVIRDEYGNAIRMLGVVMDITELKRAEEELKLDEERLEALLKFSQMKEVTEKELSDFALEECVRLTRSKVGYFHFVNEDQRTIRLFSWSKNVLKQCTAKKIQHYPVDEAGVWADCIRLRQPVIHNDYRNLPDKKGLPEGHFPVNRHLSVPVFEEGKIVAVVGVGNKEEHYDQSDIRQLSLFMSSMWEILKRQEAEEELQFQKTLLESAGEGIFGVDLNGRITFINQAAAKMLGYSSDELINQPVHERIHHSCSNGSPHPKEDCPVFSTFTKGSIHHVDDEVLWRKDGTNFFVDYTSTPIRKNVKLVGAVVTFMDITERKHTAEELEKAREAADAANRAKSEFLANMSHEIRTPMNAVIGYADLLTQLVSDETQRNYLGSIKTRGRSLMKLIDDILDLSKIEAGKLELQFDFVDTYSFFEEMEHIFSFKITEKGLDFIVNITSGTPCGLYIDEIRVRQILLNLLGNAIKFTEKGHIKLSVWTENPQVVEYSKNRIEEYVDLMIEVEDTGIGISRESGKAIFRSFQQQEGQSTKKYGGTGLGLTITKRLVELMNGTISVTSGLNKGSTFKIVIPDVAFLRDLERIDQDLFIDIGTIIFDEATLLVVDDVEHNRKFLMDALNSTAIRVFEAENGEQAYNLAREIIPDIIIVDIRMPVMDGFEFLKLIKSDKRLKHIPVIAYSASVMKSQKEKISHSDFAGFLIKPVQITELYLELMNNLSYQTVKTDQSPETGLPEKDLSTTAIENLPNIIEILETELKDKWETFSKKQPMNDVKEFGKKIIALGENNSAKIITDYGKNLVNATEAFDINTILLLLKRYPKLIEKIKITS